MALNNNHMQTKILEALDTIKHWIARDPAMQLAADNFPKGKRLLDEYHAGRPMFNSCTAGELAQFLLVVYIIETKAQGMPNHELLWNMRSYFPQMVERVSKTYFE